MGKLKSEGLEYLSTNKIERNPENPRIRFDERLMRELKDSINEIGILVPLIVFYDDQKRKYFLLDGERRLRCAKELGLDKVPANIVAKPTRLQNILEMFNIHNVRIEWGAMEVAWKIKVIMDEFHYEKEKDLARLTSLKPAEIRKAKILLSYDRKYQNLVHATPKYGGIKEDFLIELKPTLNWLEGNSEFKKYNKNEFIDSLIIKHEKGLIKNYVRDFRNLNKIVKSGVAPKRIVNIIDKLSSNPRYTINEAYEESIKYSISVNEIERKTRRLIDILSEFKIQEDSSENDKLLEVLKELKTVIQEIIDR